MARNVVLLLSIVTLFIWACGPTEETDTVSQSAEKAIEQEKITDDKATTSPDSTEKALRDSCIANQRMCEGAVAVYMKLNNGNLPEKLEDLVGEYLEEVPMCPKGGEYILDPETGSVTCSLEEHQRVEE